MVKWHLSTCLLTSWLWEEAQGVGEGPGSSSSAVFRSEKTYVHETSPKSMELAAVHTFLLSCLRGLHHLCENPAGNTNQGFSFKVVLEYMLLFFFHCKLC